MPILTFSLVAAISLAPPVPVAPTEATLSLAPPAPSAPAEASGGGGGTDSRERMVCRSRHVTGSRIRRHQTCMTARQRDAYARQSQEDNKELFENNARGVSPQ